MICTYLRFGNQQKQKLCFPVCLCDVTRHLVTTIVDVIIEHIGMTTTMTMKMTIGIER